VHDRDRRLLSATWATVLLWAIYGVAAAAATDLEGTDLQPATALRLADAQVHVQAGDDATECTWNKDAEAFRCSDDRWHYVGPYAGRSNGKPTRCMWVHPPTDGRRLVIRWEAVPLGEAVSATLALLDGAGSGAKVQADIQVRGQHLGSASVKTDRAPATVHKKLPRGDDKGSVEVIVQASSHRWRLACLTLDVHADKPPESEDEAEQRGRRGR